MWIYSNPNPDKKLVGDCVIRAICLLTNKDWDTVYTALAFQGLLMRDMPSSNAVWGKYLSDRSFRRYIIQDLCPYCYTVKAFCKDHPYGEFLLGTGTHVVAVIDGDYYDTSDSGDEVPICYWRKEI